MIINCKKCQTRFNLDENILPEEGRAVRCSRCKSVYWVRRPIPIEDQTINIKLTDEELADILAACGSTFETKAVEAVCTPQIEASDHKQHAFVNQGVTHSRHPQSNVLAGVLSGQQDTIAHKGKWKATINQARGACSAPSLRAENKATDPQLKVSTGGKNNRSLGWILLSLALFSYALHFLRVTPINILALSIALSATFFGIFYVMEDRIMIDFRPGLLAFGYGIIVGTLLRAILLLYSRLI